VLKTFDYVINDENVNVTRGNWDLTADAIPTIFPKLAELLNKKVAEDKKKSDISTTDFVTYLTSAASSSSVELSSLVLSYDVKEAENSNHHHTCYTPDHAGLLGVKVVSCLRQWYIGKKKHTNYIRSVESVKTTNYKTTR